MVIERFAPSPTGLLHLGHAYSARVAYQSAKQAGGRLLLRIEDIDFQRSKPEFEEQIYEDLNWLGIKFDQTVMRQSDRKDAYDIALTKLKRSGFVFACTCTRKDISIVTAPQEGGEPIIGPDGIVYPNTCLNTKIPITSQDAAFRIKLQVIEKKHFSFHDLNYGTIEFTLNDFARDIGAAILARRDIGISYHLAVVLDDAAQGVTHVTRGEDLLEATKIHVVLQHILGLPTPTYRHHKLIRDETGKRLAKRDDARSIKAYREAGMSAADVLDLIN